MYKIIHGDDRKVGNSSSENKILQLNKRTFRNLKGLLIHPFKREKVSSTSNGEEL